MNRPPKTTPFAPSALPILLPFCIVLIAGIIGTIFFLKKDTSPAPPVDSKNLAPLGDDPDWSQLDPFQKTITRGEFQTLLHDVYSKDNSHQPWISIHHDHALIRTHQNNPEKNYRLDFSPTPVTHHPTHSWPRQDLLNLPHAPPQKPLQNIHIAIDPGHIGGDFAKMEERQYKYKNKKTIQEGTLTLTTAKHLKPLLEKLGAKVTLVREEEKPITDKRPRDFHTIKHPIRLAEKLFYRTAEIRARARLINETIQPDLLLCLHYNATGSPYPIANQHYHLLINGAYHRNELAHDDERHQMLTRLLSRNYHTELALSLALASSFEKHTALPPYQYPDSHPYSRNLASHPALWARNLLANRSYHCPVLFFEPYIMNSAPFIERHQLGDYDGTRLIRGTPRRSLQKEYATAVAEGLADYFRETRTP